LLTVAGLLDLDRLGQLQQRLDDTPASGRAVYAINGIYAFDVRGVQEIEVEVARFAALGALPIPAQGQR